MTGWDQIHPVRALFRSKPAPRPVVADLVEFPPGSQGEPPYWTVRLYRDDFDNNTDQDKLVIFNWVSDVIQTIRQIEPNCYVEVHERAPR